MNWASIFSQYFHQYFFQRAYLLADGIDDVKCGPEGHEEAQKTPGEEECCWHLIEQSKQDQQAGLKYLSAFLHFMIH